MSEGQDTDQRLLHFHLAYRKVLGEAFDVQAFAEDAMYAFQVIERAARSASPALRNLAAHVRFELESEVENITLRAADPRDMLLATRKLQVLRDDASDPAAAWRGPERRSARVSVAPELAKQVVELRALYQQEFGRPFELSKFIADDAYGRAVLQHCQTASNARLLAAVAHFLDAQGQPTRHRRKMSTAGA